MFTYEKSFGIESNMIYNASLKIPAEINVVYSRLHLSFSKIQSVQFKSHMCSGRVMEICLGDRLMKYEKKHLHVCSYPNS